MELRNFCFIKDFNILFLFLPLLFFIFIINDLILMWIFYEIMMLIFIIYMNLMNSLKYSSIFYFMISTLSSFIFILSVYLHFMYILDSEFFNLLVQIVMMFKLGMFPFYRWMVYLYKFISWKEIFFLSTIMKLVPMYFLYNISYMNESFLWMLILNMVYISFIMKNYFYSLKMFISCSSINQSSFLILLIYLNLKIFFVYFLIYLLMFLLLIYFLDKMDVKNFHDLGVLKLNRKVKLTFIIVCMVYSSLPPFTSLILKWIFNFWFLDYFLSFYLFLFFFMLMSVIVIWNYLNLFVYSILNFNSSKKFIVNSNFLFSSLFISLLFYFFMFSFMILSLI